MTEERNESLNDTIRRAQAGDAHAMDALVRQNIALVKFIVKRYLGRGKEYDDLFQLGCMGLVKSIRNFDTEYGVAFSTYAVPVIMGEIRRFLRDDGAIRISRSIRDKARLVMQCVEDFEETALRQRSIGEIAEQTGLSSEEVLLAMNAMKPMRSLDETLSEDGSMTLRDTIGVDPSEEIDKRLEMRRLLKNLPEEEKRLLIRRYVYRDTQTEIAKDLGVSQVQVSRMESRLVEKLRKQASIEA